MTQDNPYLTAGWMAIAGGILGLPIIFLGFMLDVMSHRSGDAQAAAIFLVIYIGFAILQLFFGVYALSRFRHMLNHRFDFREVNGLITAIICGVIAVTLIIMVGRISGVVAGYSKIVSVQMIVLLALVAIPLNVLSIVFSVKLLKLNDELHGLKRPYAYLNIAAAVCFATFILALVGLLIQAACSIIMGAIFLKPAAKAEELEFV